MGLTKQSTGKRAVDNSLEVTKLNSTDKIIALAGNPNVGKSTIFNALTGLNQHTGNWPGKTVATAQGTHRFEDRNYILVDLPGSYSLMTHSAEEEVARDFILLGGADATVIVCDATCLERNMNLVLQTMEITPNTVCCVNLIDEARKKGVEPDLKLLRKNLGIPVVATSARSGKGLNELIQAVKNITEEKPQSKPKKLRYPADVEEAISELSPALKSQTDGRISSRWLALRLLAGESLPIDGLRENPTVVLALKKAERILRTAETTPEILRDRIAKCIILAAEEVCLEVISRTCRFCDSRDRKLDRILTNKLTGIPIMLALLCGILWLTITGANYPSQLLGDGLFWIQDRLTEFSIHINAPDWLHGLLVLGVYRTLAWVVSVMLPPMGSYKINHYYNPSIMLLILYYMFDKNAILFCVLI